VSDLLGLGNAEMLLRVAVAVVLGGAIGVEREISAQPAGFRTHVLLCLGAALFGLISIHAFEPFSVPRADTNVQIDVTRVASQVVVGVGFLGGGAILKERGSIRGLTTAASMWVTAAVGLAVGVGYYWAAVTVTIAVLLSLVVLRWARRWLRLRVGRDEDLVTFDLVEGADSTKVIGDLHQLHGIEVRSLDVDRDEDTRRLRVRARVKGKPGVTSAHVLAALADHRDVEEMRIQER